MKILLYEKPYLVGVRNRLDQHVQLWVRHLGVAQVDPLQSAEGRAEKAGTQEAQLGVAQVHLLQPQVLRLDDFHEQTS